MPPTIESGTEKSTKRRQHSRSGGPKTKVSSDSTHESSFPQSSRNQSRNDQLQSQPKKKQPPNTHIVWDDVITISSGSDVECRPADSGPHSGSPIVKFDIKPRNQEFETGKQPRSPATIASKKMPSKNQGGCDSNDSLSDGEIRDTPKTERVAMTSQPKSPSARTSQQVKKSRKNKDVVDSIKSRKQAGGKKEVPNVSAANVAKNRGTAVDDVKAKSVPPPSPKPKVVPPAPPAKENVVHGKGDSKMGDVGLIGTNFFTENDKSSGSSSYDGGMEEGQSALVSVTFLNSFLAKKYDSVFRKLIAGILKRESDHLDEIKAASVSDKATTIVYHDHFQEDANAYKASDKDEDGNLYGLEDDSIPLLPNKKDEASIVETVNLTPAPSFKKECFNCSGSHNLTDCKSPLDYGVINKRRLQFFNTNGSPVTGSNRYHDATSDEDMIKPSEFPDCVPGKISGELQKALGLEKGQLPSWVLKMRFCGFPPGHIRSCVKESSGLDFFDEAVNDTPMKKSTIQYDLSKLPVYPGFSAPYSKEVLKGLFVRRYGEPLIAQSNETITTFLENFAPKRAVQARSPSPDVSGGMEDMDVGEEESTAPPRFYEATIPASPDSLQGDDQVNDAGNPTSGPTSFHPNDAKPDNNGSPEPITPSSPNSLPDVLVREEVFEMVEVSTVIKTHEAREAIVLKTSSVPDLGSFSGVTALPLNEKFAEGVAPWPFEEATQSTGRYNAIKIALQASGKRKQPS